MPAPLAWAASLTAPLVRCTSRQARLGPLSLVRIAPEKLSASRPSSSQALPTPATTLSRGSSIPITPVEATPTCAGSTPIRRAAASCIAAAVSSPRWPSPTFAQPEFATTARRRLSSACFDTSTGAPSRAFVVKRAAETVSGASETSTPTSSPLGLMPAATPAARKPVGSSVSLASPAFTGSSTQREEKKLTRAPPSRGARASGSGPARPAPRRPSIGCRSRRERSRARRPPSRVPARGSCHARSACAASPRAGR